MSSLYTGSGRTKACLSVVGGIIICVVIYSFNLNISPKMSYGVLECDSYVTEFPAYDFVIKDFAIKNGRYLCQTLYFG